MTQVLPFDWPLGTPLVAKSRSTQRRGNTCRHRGMPRANVVAGAPWRLLVLFDIFRRRPMSRGH